MRILVLDDEPSMLVLCREVLNSIQELEVLTESSPPRALERLQVEHFDLLLTDLRMPVLDGVEVVERARDLVPDLVILVMTGYPTVVTAVKTMKLGAFDYLMKPFDREDFLATVQRAVEQKRLRDENRLLTRHVTRDFRMGELVGVSSAMQDVFRQIRRAASTNADVLIVGESGTGKELVARSLHSHGRRREGRFVPVDCGAIPEDLLENEFFGHERGAFTGADEASLGLMEFATGGTFFLDEVGELPLSLQAKLLRAVQERKIRRVGGRDEIEVDLRIIAASNRNLEEEVRAGRFREDLYFRINVVRLELPPLRERGEDILHLTQHMLPRLCRELHRDRLGLSNEAREAMLRYRWPGNVRELINVLKRAIVFCRGTSIGLEDLPHQVLEPSADGEGSGELSFFELRERRVAAFEKAYLHQVLRSCGGDVSAASRSAQLPRGTMYRLLKKHGLDPNDYRNH